MRLGLSLSLLSSAPVLTTFLPEQFGVVGNGTADDFDAWNTMVAAVNTSRSGLIRFSPGKVYRFDQYVTAGNGVVQTPFRNCSQIRIEGNGAKIDIKGDFHRDLATTLALSGLWFEDCQNIFISDLDIDGNVDQMTREVGLSEPSSYGLRLASCTNIALQNLELHHHSSDGLYIRETTTNTPRQPSRNLSATNVNCTYNARNNCSIIQLRGWSFNGCDFTHAGRAAGTYGAHSPAAGVDIEPNRDTLTAGSGQMADDTGNGSFTNCLFEENTGSQIVCGGSCRYDTIALTNPTINVGSGSTSGADGCVVGGRGFVISGGTINMADKIFYIWPSAANADGAVSISGVDFTGSSSLIRTNGSPTGAIAVEDCTFTATGTSAAAAQVLRFLAGTNNSFNRNTVFVPKEMYIDGGTGDRHIIFDMTQMVHAEGNAFTTDLLAAAGSSGTAHYANNYGAGTVVRSDIYTGTAPGTADTFRPVFNGNFDTHGPYSKN